MIMQSTRMPDIERDLSRLERNNNKGQRHKWVNAMIAYRYVGKRDGMTMELAKVCGLTAPDAVEHWAQAWRMYRIIRYMSGRQQANLYRSEFFVSHFHKAWEFGHKYSLSICDILSHMDTLLYHKRMGDSWSIATLEALVLAEQKSTNAVSWRWHWKRITGENMRALLSFDGELPLVVKAWVRMGLGLKERIK